MESFINYSFLKNKNHFIVYFAPFVLGLFIVVCLHGCHKKITGEIPVPTTMEGGDIHDDQWYLSGDNSMANIGLNDSRYKGRGVLIALVDDGLDIYHEDLSNNISTGSYSYLPEEIDFSNAEHGTACAGIIVAEEDNGLGIRGIAPQAKIIAFNATKTPAIANLADALCREVKRVWIYSNSWGDFNSWGEPLALRSAIRQSLEKGVKKGRNGKGAIYVFAAGNGSAYDLLLPTDNVNYSGLVNNRYTIPVGAVGEDKNRAPYSEIGATLVVCAPSKTLGGRGITTTDATGDKGYNTDTIENDYTNTNYTKNFSGTSASCPMVSGVVALMLEANPNLGWRDVKSILAITARKIDSLDKDWTTNGSNLAINHKYGFGIVSADKAIAQSLIWKNYPTEKKIMHTKQVNKIIPDNDTVGLSDTISVHTSINIEFINIYVDIPNHLRLGDLEIVLIAPFGTESILAEKHAQLFPSAFKYKNWRFGTFRHLHEDSRGNWYLTIKDKETGFSDKLLSWTLEIYGHEKY